MQLSDGALAVALGESVQVVERTAPTFGLAAGSFSGSRFERLVMADGQRLFVKHLPPEGDWITRFTDGAGRMRLLWETGTTRADSGEHRSYDFGSGRAQRAGKHHYARRLGPPRNN